MNTKELKEIADKVKDGEMPFGTARQLIGFFDCQRRGVWINSMIRRELDKLEITTFPPFENTWIDEEFCYKKAEEPTVEEGQEVVSSDSKPEVIKDPAFRIGQLESANQEPVSVNSNDDLGKAITLMLMDDFSQLPVIEGYQLKGMISWKSIASKLVFNCQEKEVRHFMDKAYEISSDESMFKAIELIKQHEAVLVRNSKNKICGIITTHDLTTQFKQLAEPFLLLAEIENQIRSVLENKLSVEDLKAAKDPEDADREIASISDLTFGEYIRIFQDPEHWEKIGLNIDRKTFSQKLDKIREVRNEVMHFKPDPLSEQDLEMLRGFSVFFQRLKKLIHKVKESND